MLADVIVVPTRPAILDLRAILETLNIVKGSKKAHAVLNACPAPRGAVEAPAATDARKALKAFGVPVAPTTISQRDIFPCLGRGLGRNGSRAAGQGGWRDARLVALR